MTFDLRAVVQAVLATGETDYQVIAAKVAEDIPESELRASLAESLRPYIREHMSMRRSVNPYLKPASAVPARSAKVAAIRDQHARYLADLVHVEDGNKPLGECTYEDLMFAANLRREHARRNIAMAERYEQLAELLQSHGVDTVAELPSGVLDGEAA